MMLSTNKRIALAYLLGKLKRRSTPEESDDSGEDSESQPPKRSSKASALNRKRHRTKQDGDQFDHFAQSLALQLRKLPEIEALKMMQQMQAMVVEKKIDLANITERSRETDTEFSDPCSEPFIDVNHAGLAAGADGGRPHCQDPIDTFDCAHIKQERED